MAERKYYWLKLREDFFEEKQIKYLRKLPDGDKLAIAYLKMQLKSLRTEGYIKYDRIMPSNEEELAMILDEDVNIVKLLISALERVGAVEVLDDGSFYLIAMQDLIGKEGQSADRVRKFREKQKQLALQCNTDVTKCNVEIEIEKEIEIDIEKDKEKEKDVIIKSYQDEIGIMTPFQLETLTSYLDEFSEEMIIEAIKRASKANKKSLSYIEGILKNWIQDGIKTLADVKENETNHTSKKEETNEERLRRLKGG